MKLIKSIRIDAEIDAEIDCRNSPNKHLKLCEIVENLIYIDKKGLSFAERTRSAHEKPAKHHQRKLDKIL